MQNDHIYECLGIFFLTINENKFIDLLLHHKNKFDENKKAV